MTDGLPDRSNPLIAKIAFSRIKGINLSTARQLVGRIGSYDNYFSLSSQALASASALPDNLTSATYRQSLLSVAKAESDFIKEQSISTHFFADDNYPARLRDCDDAPAMLYSIGRCNLDSLHTVAVVGTRHATPYGIDFVRHLVADLAQSLDSLVIISGLAYGIDVAAHRAALDAAVPTLAVVAHGLNTIYPADHRSVAAKIINEGGAIATEYPSDTVIHRGNFLARNRIVAGLADVVIVVESDARGGALSTAAIAAAYNREVMALPGRVTDTYSRGCNNLIAANRAVLVRSADDVISLMNWTPRPAPETQTRLSFDMTPEQKTIADHIIAHPDHTVNDICVALAMPYNLLSSILFEMEMNDLIITLPGGRYAVTSRQ